MPLMLLLMMLLLQTVVDDVVALRMIVVLAAVAAAAAAALGLRNSIIITIIQCNVRSKMRFANLRVCLESRVL
jgi:hypothetical protein